MIAIIWGTWNSSEGGLNTMGSTSLLKDKVILVVDDEEDVLETVEEVLDMCLVTKAQDYDTARQYLMSYTYDIVILDIMGVNGFDLLKTSAKKSSRSAIFSFGKKETAPSFMDFSRASGVSA